MLELNKIYHMNCFEGMKLIPDGSIDMILCDLPYGNTELKWDKKFSLDDLWKEYKRIIKKNGVIVLFGSQPFTSLLVTSNLKWFKYNYVWIKENSTGFPNANARPLKKHEDILVFSEGNATSTSLTMTYNPQGLIEVNKITKYGSRGGYLGERASQSKVHLQKYTNYPTTILEFKRDKEKLHPTQKPIALCEYLIKTFSNENEIVLDNCMGSATTAIACINTNRNYIGFEIKKEYYDTAIKRIEEHKSNL